MVPLVVHPGDTNKRLKIISVHVLILELYSIKKPV